MKKPLVHLYGLFKPSLIRKAKTFGCWSIVSMIISIEGSQSLAIDWIFDLSPLPKALF
ncbi:MAG: hypothetical protein WED10_04560 [Brumimicrobium sp.]